MYAQLGRRSPRTAAEQYRRRPDRARSQAQPGDLVFYLSGGTAYHVGIYLGGNQMYRRRRTRAESSPAGIYSANVAFGQA